RWRPKKLHGACSLRIHADEKSTSRTAVEIPQRTPQAKLLLPPAAARERRRARTSAREEPARSSRTALPRRWQAQRPTAQSAASSTARLRAERTKYERPQWL